MSMPSTVFTSAAASQSTAYMAAPNADRNGMVSDRGIELNERGFSRGNGCSCSSNLCADRCRYAGNVAAAESEVAPAPQFPSSVGVQQQQQFTMSDPQHPTPSPPPSNSAARKVSEAVAMAGGDVREFTFQSQAVPTLTRMQNLLTSIDVGLFRDQALATSLLEDIWKNHDATHRSSDGIPYFALNINKTNSILAPLKLVMRGLGMRNIRLQSYPYGGILHTDEAPAGDKIIIHFEGRFFTDNGLWNVDSAHGVTITHLPGSILEGVGGVKHAGGGRLSIIGTFNNFTTPVRPKRLHPHSPCSALPTNSPPPSSPPRPKSPTPFSPSAK